MWAALTVSAFVAVGAAGGSAQAPVRPPSAPRAPVAASPETSSAPTNKSPARPPKARAAPLVPAPHPLMTEVLFAVPTGEKGDANGDGTREVSGDEFIELVNPHEEPIDLGGYRLADRSMGTKDAMGFVFPACTLEPGQVVVVFNGHKSTFDGPVGDARRAPSLPHERFHKALVFSMNNTKSRIGLANGGDLVALVAPGGEVVEVVRWGQFDEKPPAAPLMEEAPASARGSVTRQTLDGPFVSHDALGVPFSPGEFPPIAGSPPPPTTPASATPTSPAKPPSKPK
ncbi:MAG: lamin tail domain-containing protein [Phycisphaerales bacterium]